MAQRPGDKLPARSGGSGGGKMSNRQRQEEAHAGDGRTGGGGDIRQNLLSDPLADMYADNDALLRGDSVMYGIVQRLKTELFSRGLVFLMGVGGGARVIRPEEPFASAVTNHWLPVFVGDALTFVLAHGCLVFFTARNSQGFILPHVPRYADIRIGEDLDRTTGVRTPTVEWAEKSVKSQLYFMATQFGNICSPVTAAKPLLRLVYTLERMRSVAALRAVNPSVFVESDRMGVGSGGAGGLNAQAGDASLVANVWANDQQRDLVDDNDEHLAERVNATVHDVGVVMEREFDYATNTRIPLAPHVRTHIAHFDSVVNRAVTLPGGTRMTHVAPPTNDLNFVETRAQLLADIHAIFMLQPNTAAGPRPGGGGGWSAGAGVGAGAGAGAGGAADDIHAKGLRLWYSTFSHVLTTVFNIIYDHNHIEALDVHVTWQDQQRRVLKAADPQPTAKQVFAPQPYYWLRRDAPRTRITIRLGADMYAGPDDMYRMVQSGAISDLTFVHTFPQIMQTLATDIQTKAASAPPPPTATGATAGVGTSPLDAMHERLSGGEPGAKRIKL